MRAQMIRKNGGPEVLEAAEVDRPSAGAGQVLVEVAASSVNTADLMARSMGPVVDFIPTPPAVLGIDFAGTVVAVGDGVAGFAAGDRSTAAPVAWRITPGRSPSTSAPTRE